MWQYFTSPDIHQAESPQNPEELPPLAVEAWELGVLLCLDVRDAWQKDAKRWFTRFVQHDTSPGLNHDESKLSPNDMDEGYLMIFI